MINRTHRVRISVASIASAAIACAAVCHADPVPTGDTLLDSGFESGSGALQAFFRSCGDPYTPGEWNAEDANLIVGPDGGVTPHTSDGMLRLNAGGGNASQVNQIIDLSACAVTIDEGKAVAIFSVWTNSSGPAVAATMILQAGTSQTCVGTVVPAGAGTFVQGLNQVNSSLTSDADQSTWELVACSMRLPIGTRFLSAQVSAPVADIPAGGLFFDTSSVAICATSACFADIDGDGNVGSADLAVLLGFWGPCP